MKRTSKFVRVIIATAAIAALVAVALPAGAQTSDGSYIVVLKDSVGSAKSVAAEHSRRHSSSVSHVYEHALKGYAATVNSARLGALRSDPRVDYVEKDGRVTALATQSNPPSWGLDRIDDLSGLDSSFNYTSTGTDVTAYIIDTGIRRSHQEFGGRASAAGFDAVSPSTGGDDCNGHGTHVAGTVGGATYGVAKNVTLVAVRVLDCGGSGYWSWVISGLDFVKNHHASGQRAVANMSLGGGASSAVDTAVNNAINDGVAFAVAAGNSNRNACNYSPARVTNALTVGASTSSDAKASFSNYGSCVDVYAPGVSITSSTSTEDTSQGTWSGTSMASPHTAGVAALYLSTSGTDPSPAAVSTALLNKAAAPGSIKILDSTTTTGKGKNRTTTQHFKPLLFTDY